MLHPWIKEYILLALQIDNFVKNKTGEKYIDSYTGPQELNKLVESQGHKKISNLKKSINELKQELYQQNFNKNRSQFLRKHLQSMEMILNILNNENISLARKVKSCLDIDIKWISEDYFEHGINLFKKGLLGKQDIYKEFNKWYERNNYNNNDVNKKKEIIYSVIKEVRNRTRKIVDLPEKENIKVEMVSGRSFGAATWYLGDYCSLVQINQELPLNLFYLLTIIIHELYPGHHTEHCLKEKYQLHELNYGEQQLFITNSPRLVIAEGIAETAFDIIFTPEEAAEWMVKNIYNKLNIKTDDVNLPYLYRAARFNSLDQICGNAAIMFNDGCTENEVRKYIKKYTLLPEELINHVVNRFKTSLFKSIYSFSYFYGKKILKDLLDKEEKQIDIFNSLLKEETYPSLLLKKY